MRKFILNKIPVDDYDLKKITEKVLAGESKFQFFLNVHKIVMMSGNKNPFEEIDVNKSLFSVDGIWIQWLSNYFNIFPKQRFGGVDVILNFAKLSQENNFTIYFHGSTEKILKLMITNLKKKYPKVKICGYSHGFYNNDKKIIDEVVDLKPDFLFLALPSPKKELFGYKIFKKCNSLKYAAGVGGAYDIIAGISPRAPNFIQKIGIEWLYRICLSPRRLFVRYFSDGIMFISILIKYFLKRI